MEEYRRIMFTSPCVAELIPVPAKEMGPKKVLVKLAVTTISSGTERANLIGERSTSPNKSYEETVVRWPRSAGYSSSGIVWEVGEKVTKVKPGDRVAVFWSHHGEYSIVDENEVVPISDDTPFEEAAMWHICCFPLAAIRKCRLEFGESLIVMGFGILGIMAARIALAAGAAPVIVADPIEWKRKYALEKVGVDYALDPTAPDFVSTVKEITGGGCNVGIEVTGVGAGLNGVLDVMARFGRVGLLGCTRHSDFSVDYYRKVHFPGITLVGAHTAARPEKESHDGWWITYDDMNAIRKMVEAGRIHFQDLIQETHSPEECGEVFRRLATESGFPIVQFDWRTLWEKD